MGPCKVNRDNTDYADESWEYLRDNSILWGENIYWSFAKFLVTENGSKVKYLSPDTKMEKVEKEV